MPKQIIHAFGISKKCSAVVNRELGRIDSDKADVIVQAAHEVQAGRWDDHFPLVVWQTGSGTQSHMNVNEVIASRANQLLEEKGIDKLVHPNDDVNKSQSSNDGFQTALHIASVLAVENHLLPAIDSLKKTFAEKMDEFDDIVKTGRTHLQDAVPVTLGQEISGWHHMLVRSEEMVKESTEQMKTIPLGGTAVGTGLNSHSRFSGMVAKEVSEFTGTTFLSSSNKFHAITSHDEITYVHGALKALAADFMKIANDVKWLASGPNSGIGELSIPANEPGSSFMPGKVNPTQSEAATMVAVQVMSNDAAIGLAASQGNFEFNAFKPVIAYNFLQSVRLLGDSLQSFNDRCAIGIEPNRKKIQEYLDKSLMLVTALNPHIGYEKAATIAKLAHKEDITLKEAAVKSGILTEDQFDEFVKPEDMIHPQE